MPESHSTNLRKDNDVLHCYEEVEKHINPLSEKF